MKKSILAIGMAILFIGMVTFASATNVTAKTNEATKESLPIKRTYWPVTTLSGNILVESYTAKEIHKGMGWINVDITGVVKEQPRSGHTGFFIGFAWPQPIFHPFAPRIPEGTHINLKISVLLYEWCTDFNVGEICGFAWNPAINVHLTYL